MLIIDDSNNDDTVTKAEQTHDNEDVCLNSYVHTVHLILHKYTLLRTVIYNYLFCNFCIYVGG